jgi:hypothetical protein
MDGLSPVSGTPETTREQRAEAATARAERDRARATAAALEAECAALEAFVGQVQWAFDLQCPPVRSHFGKKRFGAGAYCAHRWWNSVLGGILRDERVRAARVAD